MEIYSIENLALLSTATRLDELKTAALEYLTEYENSHPETAGITESFVNVIKLRTDKTKGLLRYPDMAILNVLRFMIFHSLPIEAASRMATKYTAGQFVYETYAGKNRAVKTLKAWSKADSKEIKEINDKLYSLHTPDLEAPRIENHSGGNIYQLDLIGRKAELEKNKYKYAHYRLRDNSIRWNLAGYIESRPDLARALRNWNYEGLEKDADTLADLSGMNTPFSVPTPEEYNRRIKSTIKSYKEID